MSKKKEKEMVSLIRLVSALTLCWGIPSELDCHSFLFFFGLLFLSIYRKKKQRSAAERKAVLFLNIYVYYIYNYMRKKECASLLCFARPPRQADPFSLTLMEGQSPPPSNPLQRREMGSLLGGGGGAC